MEALVIQMAREIRAPALQCEEAFQGLNVREILIGRGNDTSNSTTLDGCFNIFEQQNQASLLDEADREIECRAAAKAILNLLKKGNLRVIC